MCCQAVFAIIHATNQTIFYSSLGNDSTTDDYVAAMDFVINLVGEDLVGVGSDDREGHARSSDFMAWYNLDKGYAPQLTLWGNQTVVKPLGPLKERPELAKAMARVGWS
ncbi:Peptidase M19, renal dipeptidase [Penicillium italicum]|uniref:Peptidase M19, renal dipeptidase n=1 Tax=Penicillium italicum TaxID=40296 RepID=A0A0A2L652_PENIT|nr:Peptidase M19, renal dipeptidase [Penicillium italicum]